MTSVKEFRVETEPTATAAGRGRFVFTDQYSVFDWGEMPDHVPGKGASLCTMGAYNFERLEAEGIPTHYVGVVDAGRDDAADDAVADSASLDATDPVALEACEAPPTEMAIELTQVPDLPYLGDDDYDYDAYHDAAGENYLIPLEIVFRNTVPEGSSLRSRGSPADYGLDRESWPDGVVDLPERSRHVVSERLAAHRRYVREARADGTAFEYEATHYDFPVRTRQEREIRFRVVDDVERVGSGENAGDVEEGQTEYLVQYASVGDA